jgi:formylmethanofuran dehydrogenase subunit C
VRDHAAMGMRGGLLEIGGHAGAFLGSAPPGERLGLRGGLVTVGGTVGERAGDRMRRGMILVAGNAGAACGARMVAGTIAIAGRLGPLPGLRMRRGTIVAAAASEGAPDTFADTGRADLTIFKLLARRLGGAASWIEPLLTGRPLRRLAGDLAVDGKGEILLFEG